MTTITIPQNFTSNDDLVAIPRKQYESLLHAKEKNSLDKELIEALDDVKMGRVIGPFSSLSAGLKALKMSK
ncbi:MAG: hypothetical protein WC878_05210 [Candidatus Paceibacterota bacterium]